MVQIAGSCLCGSVSYQGEAEPAFVAFCHCRGCQKASGAAYSANVAVPSDQLEITGPLGSYETQGGSGNRVARHFCSQCGSPIAICCGGPLEGLSLVQAGTLHEPSWVSPGLHIFCSSAQPWDVLPEDATCLPGAPPAAA